MSKCTALTSYKGRGAVSIALRNPDGTLGQWFPIAEARLLEISNSQEFEDIYSRCDRAGGQILHSLQQTDQDVSIETYDFSPESLARAYYGTHATVAAGNVTNEGLIFKAKDETIPLNHPFGVTGVVVNLASTVLVEGTDYSVDYEHGTITVLVDPVDGVVLPVTLDVDYSYIEYDTIQAGMTGVQEYAVRFDGINVNDNLPYQVYLWRVSINLSASLSLITEETASLEMSGKLLVDNTRPIGESKYWVAKIGKVAV